MVAAKPMNNMLSHQSTARSALRWKSKSNFRLLIAIMFLHFPIGLLDYYLGSAAIIHPAATVSIGIYWAWQRKVRLERVALAVGYLVGVEILWRMAQVPIFWEFGKYGSAAIMIVALVRRHRRKIPVLPLVYLAALLPACVLTIIQFNLS